MGHQAQFEVVPISALAGVDTMPKALPQNSIADAIDAAEERYPGVSVSSAAGSKKNWSQEFSTALAEMFAKELRNRDALKSAVHGEKPVVTSGGAKKRTDVRVSDPVYGLTLVISIKTTNFRDSEVNNKGDRKIKDFNHNLSRFDNELRTEAHEIHTRAPFAILVGLVFLPHESVVPRIRGKSSGFARWVNRLRQRAQRSGYRDEPEKFERMFVGLYVKSGPNRGAIRFFDVANIPPIYGFPDNKQLLSVSELTNQIEYEHRGRNKRILELTNPGEWSVADFASTPSDFDALGYTSGVVTGQEIDNENESDE